MRIEGFSATYKEARDKFRAAADAAGARTASWAHPLTGPDGCELSTDTAWIGPEDAASVMVLTSGTHGVEGFCGSGIQVGWLQSAEAKALPPGVAVLMVHAVNPYGFAWLRRVNEDNIDVNRNWVDFSKALPENPSYLALREAIVPETWTAESVAAADARLHAYAAEHGMRALQAAVSVGQWSDPQGIFYGGAGPSWSRQTYGRILSEQLAGAANIALLDVHTGLGPYGYCERILAAGPRDAALQRAAAWYGLGGIAAGAEDSVSAPVGGDNLNGVSQLLPGKTITAVALEYGVAPLWETMTAVRADAWLHARGDLASEQGKDLKRRIRNAFFGDTDEWKGMVIAQAMVLCRQTLAGLSAGA
jgi:hypothetical protein